LVSILRRFEPERAKTSPALLSMQYKSKYLLSFRRRAEKSSEGAIKSLGRR